MEKPPILSDRQIQEWSDTHVGEALLLDIVGNGQVAQLNADVAYYEPLIQQARQEVSREIWEDVVCPMCYRLNPHHAHENKGKGCNWCSEKEHYTGQMLEQSLKSKYGGQK